MSSKAVFVVGVQPQEIWCDFLNSFNHYDVFIVVDDEGFDLSEFRNKYQKINFIQLTQSECGDFNRSNILLRHAVSGWDKAICSAYDSKYEKVWLLENDVFFNDENTLLSLDERFPEDDLLSRKYEINKNGQSNYWHWSRVDPRVDPPWYNAMVCTVRVSNKLLKCIGDYAKKHNTLFFIEALFPTIAIKNELKYSTPDEFDEILFRKEFNVNNITSNRPYHPVKDLNHHLLFRNHLKEKSREL